MVGSLGEFGGVLGLSFAVAGYEHSTVEQLNRGSNTSDDLPSTLSWLLRSCAPIGSLNSRIAIDTCT